MVIAAPDSMPADAAKRYLSTQRAKALELADTKRRIQEAEVIIVNLKHAFQKGKAGMQATAKKATLP